MNNLLRIAALGTFLFSAFGVTAQADTKKPAKSAVKRIDLKYCPMTAEDAEPSKNSVKYKNYNVNFCCPGCDTEFKGLSNAEKDKKIAVILKKQNTAKKS